MNGKNQKRGILQVLLAAIVAAIVCSSSIAGAQVRPAQCEEYTRAAHVTLTRGRNVSILTMLAMAWEGLTDAEGTGYLNRGETPRRVLLRSAWPTRGASISPGWAPPAANAPLLTMGQLVIDNPGRWTTRYHKIFIVDVPETVHITRSLSVSVTENVRELPATPLQIGYRRDRVDVTTLGRLVAQPSATATTVDQLFTADASWFHLPADAVTQRTYSNWKVETLTGLSDRSRTFSIRRIGARRALQRSCEALPRVDSVITGEDRAQLAELLVELDGVGSDPDAQADLQSAVTAAHARVVSALSQQLRPDREAIASANAGRDGWQNAAVKNEASAKSWRKVFEGYRALIIRNVIIASILLFILFSVLVASILLRKPTMVFRDSTPPEDNGHCSSKNPGELPAPKLLVVETRIVDNLLAKAVRALCEKVLSRGDVRHPTDDSLASLVGAADAAANKLGLPSSTATVVTLTAPDGSAIIANEDALTALLDAAKAEGKASAPTPQQIEGMIDTARQAGYSDGFTAGATSRNDEVKNLTDRVGELETAARATAISYAAKVREIETERDSLSARLTALVIFARDVFEIVFERQLALVDGNVPNPTGVADQIETEIELLRTGISGKLQLAYTALREIKASGGKARIVKIARRGLGEKVEETGARPATRSTAASAPDADEEQTTDFTTAELLAASVDDVEASMELVDEAPAAVEESHASAPPVYHRSFRRLYDRFLGGARGGEWAAGITSAFATIVASLHATLEQHGYESEAIDLYSTFAGCPEITWGQQASVGARSNAATTKLSDVTPDGRTPARLVLDRYAAIASITQRIVNGETSEVFADSKIKKVFEAEMGTLVDELKGNGNQIAATILVNGLAKSRTSAARTRALPRAQAKPTARTA